MLRSAALRWSSTRARLKLGRAVRGIHLQNGAAVFVLWIHQGPRHRLAATGWLARARGTIGTSRSRAM